MNILIGEQQSEYINLEIVDRLYPNSVDYWDGNYLKTVLELEIPAFKSSFVTNIRTFELNRFLDELTNLKVVGSECLLSNVDENINIIGKVNYTGSIDWNCTIIYPAGNGARLKFNINTSSTLVDKLIVTIKDILETWPIIGEMN